MFKSRRPVGIATLVGGTLLAAALALSSCSTTTGEASGPAVPEQSDASSADPTQLEEQQGTPVSEDECVDVNAENPTVQQLYEGVVEIKAKYAVANGDDESTARQLNSYSTKMDTEIGREQVKRHEDILKKVPPGAYAKYVRAYCRLDIHPSARIERVTPWGLAALSVAECLQLESADENTKENLRVALEDKHPNVFFSIPIMCPHVSLP
jgi:hypothetical protein